MMSDLVPDTARIDRHALERIIRRAAELQAGERDIGEGLTESDLMLLGKDVGIPARYLQQALLEEQTRSVMQAEPGLASWLAGPRYVVAQRSVADTCERVHTALGRWMTEGELLIVKRRFPNRTSWEPRRDMFSSIKRELKVGGRAYRLAQAREIVGQVWPLDGGRCHVQLLADLANTRRSRLSGATTLAGSGAVATTIGLALGVMVPVALLPAGIGLVAGAALARKRMGQVEQVQVSLEQVLDRLEHGEISADRPGADRGGTIERLASEIRRNLGV
jgi:hypothetical protein